MPIEEKEADLITYTSDNEIEDISTQDELLEFDDENNDQDIDPKGNKKSVFWLVSIFSSTSTFFFGNFFSAFAAEAGVSGSVMGFLTSIRNLLSSLFQGFIGLLSDKIGRKFVMFGGILLNFAITVPLIFFEQTWLLITVAIVQALSISLFVPAWNATQGDVTNPEIRATFIGKLASIGRLVSVSFSLGIAILFYLADEVYYGKEIWGWTVNIPWRTQYSIAFAIAAINSLITAILILTMKETKTEDVEKKKLEMRAAFKVRSFMIFVAFYALFGFSMSFIWPINPIIQVNVLDMEFYQIAIISSIFLSVMSITQFVSGKLGDKIGRKPLFLFGAFILVFYPVSNLPSLYLGDWRWQILGNFVAGFGTGTFFVALNALTLDLASNELMGTFSGVREMFWGIATFVGSLASGFLVDFLEVRYGLLITTIAMCIAVSAFRLLTAAGFLFVAESLPKKERENRLNHKNHKKNSLDS